MRHVVLSVALFTGCVGQVEPGDQGGMAPDPGGASPDAAVDGPGFACRDRVTSVGSGNHNAGMDCQDSCHNHGFTLAGTLFAAPNSATPLAGATVTIVDAAGKTVDIVSQRNGNFYTSQRFTFPIQVTASLCPSVAPMATRLTSAMNGCNQGGCHVAGAQGVIHLP